MKTIKLYFLIISGLLSGALNCKAISPFYTNHINFKQLTIQDGLKDNTVLSIHKDAKGIMWLGTSTGLSKYDGNRFTNYALSQRFSMNVIKIEEDHRHILYLQTNDWITYMDCKSESTGKLQTLVKNKDYQVADFLLLNDSTLLACDNQTFSSFNISLTPNGQPSSKLKKIYSFKMAEKERFMKFCLTNNHKEVYLVTNNARVLLLDISTGRILKEKRLLTTKQEFGASSIIYHNEKLFISSMLHGIFIMDTSLENLSHIVNQQNRIPTHLSHNDVYNITPISNSSILATTWNGYTTLSADNNVPGGWTTKISTGEPTWQSLNFEPRMISSYYDPHGFLWIGTHGGGVLVADWKWNFIKQYNFNEDNEVESIIIDNDERSYWSTYEQGVFYSNPLHDPENFTLRELPQTDRKTVLCSMKDENGNIWFGYQNGMIVCYSPLKKEVQKYHVTDTPVNVLFTDSKKNFWIGTSKGLFLYDCDKKEKKEVALKQAVNCVFDIDEDNEGYLWIATSLGLLKLSYTNNKQHIQHFTTDKHTYTAQTVLTAKDGTVYVGYQNGLGIVYHRDKTIKQVFTTTDGLASNWINCLLEDKQGYIWIGTNSGFSCYDKSINQFYNYYASGSSHSVTFWGDMLCWGGNRHLIFFSPQQAINAFQANTENPIIITGIEINNKPLIPGKLINGQMILTKTAEYTDYISLPYKSRDFSLSFSNSPYPTTQKYVYRLIPYQNEWIECNGKDKISYANLLPGNYTFQIKNQKAVKEDVTSLEINIQPHWSQTWTFRIFVFLVIIGAIYYSIFTFKRKHQRDQLITELEHGIAIYKLQHEQEIKLKEEQETFFTKATHELRPLLALILSPLEELLYSMKPCDDSYSKLTLIKRNVHSLCQQVDQLSHVQETKINCSKEEKTDNSSPEEKEDRPLSDHPEPSVLQQSNINNEFKQSDQYIFMQKVLVVIEDNIANEQFNVKILADMLCMSQPTLYRKVKEHFHLTVTELIRKIRMNKAISLLAMHKYSILEIAEMVGYNDYETFRKHFKSQFGISASKYVNGK
ncbi:two-component regulator propeller domain-containing protein [Bacteroides fragilis]|uniref:two-component regulator propeller domain-containing protein n=1 Tax=Bacteroides fragilis TaxID=817 RepID=UPI001C70A400|nr:two-component regulator propeller domain-containing protein [Bacteroides fragilis]MBW9279958.1 helix-turn-helix domain-containing protein [Bacteroides fragilis]